GGGGGALDTAGFNTSLDAPLAAASGGTGALTKKGAGVLQLNATASSFSGGVTVSEGTLLTNAPNALGSGPLTLSGASGLLDLGSSHAQSVGTLTVSNGGALTGSGSASLTASSYDLRSGTLAGTLKGSGAINKTTSGTVTLSGA